MPKLNEVEIYPSTKLPNLGEEQPIVNRQVIDAIKHVDLQLNILRGKLREVQEIKQESFKYISAKNRKSRLSSNENKEIQFKSSDNSIDFRLKENSLDLKIKNVDNIVAGYIKDDGTVPLIANWDAGSFKITAEQFESDIATGAAPFPCASTTLNPNLNAGLVDGYHHDQSLLQAASPSFNRLMVDRIGLAGSEPNTKQYFCNIVDTTLTMTDDVIGSYTYLYKTHGASDYADDLIGGYYFVGMNDSDTSIGELRGINGIAFLNSGAVGASGNAKNATGLWFECDMKGGVIWGNVIGCYAYARLRSASEVKGDLIGAKFQINTSGTIGGTSYLMYLLESATPDYCIYQNGDAPNLFGGDIQLSQIDGNERIGSDASGYVDLYATTAIRLNMSIADTDVRTEYIGTSNTGVLVWMEDEDFFHFLDSVRIGTTDNYSEIGNSGNISQSGTARRSWNKYTANSVTITVGTTDASSVVANLQNENNNLFHLQEVAGTPGIDFYVEFIDVTAFNWVRIRGTYVGGTSHGIGILLYNWGAATWDHRNDMQDSVINTGANQHVIGNQSFVEVDDSNYIGTGGNLGKVRIKFVHPMAGSTSHDIYVDVVALYQ